MRAIASNATTHQPMIRISDSVPNEILRSPIRRAES